MAGAVTSTIGMILLFLKNIILVQTVYQLQNNSQPLAGYLLSMKDKIPTMSYRERQVQIWQMNNKIGEVLMLK
jgi:hypothetical protein